MKLAISQRVAADGDLGLFIALGPCGREGPCAQALSQEVQGFVTGFNHGALPRGVLAGPGVGQARRNPCIQLIGNKFFGVLFGSHEGFLQLDFWRQVDA